MESTDSQPRLLVETDWLAAHLDDPSLVIADCRFVKDEEASRAAYRAGHIPGAIHVYWLRDLCTAEGDVYCLLPSPQEAAARLGRLGIGNGERVVAYADQGGLYATRLWHVLAYYGHPHVYLLNGGLEKWVAESRPLSTEEVAPRPATFVPSVANGALRIRVDELARRLDDPSLALADARTREEYDGSVARSARGGHIPGARLVPWEENLRPDWTFRSPAEIRARHKAAGIAPDREVVTYCQGGVRAAQSALSLLLAGYPRVRVYDGSWAEWGNDPDLPLATG